MHITRLLIALAALIVVALVATGCSDSSTDTTAADDSGDAASGVVFGRGSVPDTVPESFPIPDEAVIGATLVDTNRGLTEMVVTFPASVEAVVQYYEENLPSNGYEITRSEGNDADWLMAFDGDGVDGVLRITIGGASLSAATVQLTEV
jgi:hypothetical protein